MTDPPHGDPHPNPVAPPPTAETDALIVGSGVAGLSAALELAHRVPGGKILLVTRGALGGHGASPLAQGGVAAAIDPTDSPALHARDTAAAGADLTHPDLVEILTRDGPGRVRALMRIGAKFDRDAEGSLALGLEAAHSRRRILHASGDRTGAEVTRALRDAVRSSAGITVLEDLEALELLTRAGRVAGILARDAGGAVRQFRAKATLLATGGAGRVYLRTTSPPGLNGDGLAMAARAGARLMDLEFVQFHPTALNVDADPLPLVTEALRGAGARLIDARGAPALDPGDVDELASRDLVARALWTRMRDGTSVFLDGRSIRGGPISQAFPGVYSLCRAHGIDPDREPIPVTPAAHYHMGGIATDEEGRSSLPGLWAAGEVSASGVHGANRLASNSLLEGLVFGPRAARSMGAWMDTGVAASRLASPDRSDVDPASPEGETVLAPEVVHRIRQLLWTGVGVVRDERGLVEVSEELDAMEHTLRSATPAPSRNLLLVARLIAHSALARRESRGCHFRKDFPHAEPGPGRHSLIELDADGAVRAALSVHPVVDAPLGALSSRAAG